MVTTRFAPSPTGHLHVGNLRAALFNFLIARSAGGSFILRLDDTDPERSKPEFVDSIMRDLEWLGLSWDRVERQSGRLDKYLDAADRLRQQELLYECFESPSELALRRKAQLGMGRPPVYDRSALSLAEEERDRLRNLSPGYWRFLLNGEKTNWSDGIQGSVSVDSSSLSDPVLIRADGQFLYTLASVVDDLEMRITDIVRGADHVTNTAVQIQIMQRLGHEPPRFSHHSLLVGPEGEPLAKRLGTLAVRDLRENGVEPMALLSLMAFSGSSLPVRPCVSIDEILEAFSLQAFGTTPTRFDPGDVEPLTERILARLPFSGIAPLLDELGVPGTVAPAFWSTVRENLKRRSDLADWWKCFSEGATPLVADEDREFVTEALGMLDDPPYGDQTWENWTKSVSEKTGRGGRKLFLPLRKALTGKPHGPEMKAVMPLLQRVERRF
ncbi:MAG: glutamate--tRNA ligase [Rhodobacteraceae bacterium]|nr:glutamate--tRNA ligase [Paracoccaceae bacterium]